MRVIYLLRKNAKFGRGGHQFVDNEERDSKTGTMCNNLLAHCVTISKWAQIVLLGHDRGDGSVSQTGSSALDKNLVMATNSLCWNG